MQVTRNYAHKSFGQIGKVELSAPKGKWTLDGKELPESSVEHLLMFALQTLQDSYAGAESADDAKGRFGTKYDRLVEGTIGTRGSGDGASFETVVGRSVMRNAFKVKVGAKSEAWATFTGLSDADQIAKLDAWLAGPQGAALADAIAEEIAIRKARAANKAKAAGAVEFDI